MANIGFEALTIGNSAVSLNPVVAIYSKIVCFVGWLETADGSDTIIHVRVRFDGTAPTANTGELILSGSYVTLDGEEIRKAKFIRSDGSDALLQGHYYDRPVNRSVSQWTPR